MVAGGNCCCCTRGCKVCNNETVTDTSPQWQASISFDPNPDYGFPPNPFGTCDCDSTPFVTYCCSDLDQDPIALDMCGPGFFVNCAPYTNFWEEQDEYGVYLDGWHRIEIVDGGGTCPDAPQCCLWGTVLEMCCTNSSNVEHCFGSWYSLCFGFIRLYTDDDTWTLAAAVYLAQYYSGENFYQYIDLGVQKVDCSTATYTFDDLQTLSGNTNLGYCQPQGITVESV